MWETQVPSLVREDPLEKEMVIHSSTISWKIPWTEVPGRLQSMGSQRVGHDWMTSLSLSLSRLVQWFVWASHRVRFVLIEILFVCLFFLWLARPSEVVTLSADDWVCFVLFFRWGVLHRVLLVVGWCWVLCSSGFLCVSSHYLILPRVSSMVI